MAATIRFFVRQLRFVRVLVLLVIGGVAGLYFYAAHLATEQLQDAIAEADALEPDWKLEDWRWGNLPSNEGDPGLEALTAATARLPSGWPSQEMLEDLRDVAPHTRLQESALTRLGSELERAADALAEARKLSEPPPAALRFPWQDPWSANLEPTQKLRLVSYLLLHDALDCAQRGDAVGALVACRAALHVCRAIDGTSLAIGFLIRVATCDLALRAIETTLAWTQPGEVDLAALQALVAAEQQAPALLEALRCERASLHWGLSAMESGERPMSHYLHIDNPSNDLTLPPVAGAYDRLGIPMVQYVHAFLLRYYVDLVAVGRLPCTQRNPRLMLLRLSLIPRWYTVPPAANLLASNHLLFNSDQRAQARLRSMVAALAVERHRQRTGAWPETLADIAPQPLPEAWTDPYDGEPLRYRRLADGVAVYSVGPDLQDNQGKFERNYNTPGTDLGVRLWDVERRGQPR